MFPKFYYKLICFDKNIIGQIGVQGLNKYLNLPYTHPQPTYISNGHKHWCIQNFGSHERIW